MLKTEDNFNKRFLIIKKREKFMNIKTFINQIKKILKSEEESSQNIITKDKKKFLFITV